VFFRAFRSEPWRETLLAYEQGQLCAALFHRLFTGLPGRPLEELIRWPQQEFYPRRDWHVLRSLRRRNCRWLQSVWLLRADEYASGPLKYSYARRRSTLPGQDQCTLQHPTFSPVQRQLSGHAAKRP